MKTIFNTKRIFIYKLDLESESVIDLIRTYFVKGKIAKYSELGDNLFCKLQTILLGSGFKGLSFVRCGYFARDI